jgi:predicted signal transduction protein with EAL and GGDEF domain
MQNLSDTFASYIGELERRWRDPAFGGWLLVVLAIATFAVVAWVDHLLPPEISVTALYLVPIAVIAWYLGRFAGHVSVLVGVGWKVASDLLSIPPTAALTTAWGAFTLVALAVSVTEVLTLLHRALDAEHGLARTDSLTGVPNARAFRETALTELERVKRYGGVFTLASLDLDHFKEVNDAKGHLVETGCCATSVRRSWPVCARSTWWRAWGATSSPCCCRTPASGSRASRSATSARRSRS